MRRSIIRRLIVQPIALAVGLSVLSSLALAQGFNKTAVQLDIKQQPLAESLKMLADQFSLQIAFYSATTEGIEAPSITGRYTPEQALGILLQGTALEYRLIDNKTVAVRPRGNADPLALAQADSHNGVGGVETREKRPRYIDEVIVTAQKREQSAYDVPISILAFSSEDLKAQMITDWNDLALAVPGLLTSTNGGAQYVYMRGLGNISGASSMVGIYVDEISVSSGWSIAQLDTRLHDLERVEVLRGPQGTLYGQGAMAGTIRFITKDPQLDSFGFKADFEASFTQDGAPSQQAQTVVNIPLITDTLGLRISGTFEHAGGWIDQPIGNQKDINTQDVTNVRVKGLWHPADALAVKATAIVHRNDFSPPGEQEDGNFTPAFDVFTPAVFDDQYELYNLTLSYDFDAMNLLSTSSYVNTDKSARHWGSVASSALNTMLDPWMLESDIFTQEVRLSSTSDGRLQWSFGGLYEEWEQDTGFTLFYGAPGPLPSSPLFSQVTNYTSDSWAVFGDASFALTPRLEIGAGLRYFEDQRSQATRFGDVVTGTFAGDYDALSPRFYVNYDVTDDVKIYGSAAKGFRSGGGATFNLTSGTPKGYGPETVWTYELGAKGSLFDGRLVGDITVFYTDYSDVIVRLLPPPPDSALFGISEINAGDAEIRGVEGNFTWQVGDDLRLGVIGTWLDSEFTSVIGTQRPKLPGDRLDFVKDYQFALWAEFEFNWADRPGSVRVDYNQQGPAEYSSRVSTNPFFIESDVINMLNLRATWEWSDSLYLGVFGQNLLNDRGIAEPIGGTGPFAKLQHPRPRTVGVEFGIEF